MEQEIKQATMREPPGFMVVKVDVIERVLIFSGDTVLNFANDLDVDMLIAYKILSGEKMGVHPSRSFINHYRAEFAHRYIDWAVMGMCDPYRKFRKRNVKKRHVKAQ